MYKTDNLNISAEKEVITPADLMSRTAITEDAAKCVYESRQAIARILRGEDDRLVVVVGPCSVHDVDAAIEYSTRLKQCIKQYADCLHIIMRVYFEKPRTTVGWKGLINDPLLDESFQINLGLKMARSLLLRLNESGVSAATEYLDLISPQYISDLVSWGAIGARTTESQTHRELASGVSCPVGFKNGTDGGVQIAIDAVGAASRPHNFLSVTKRGRSAIFSTKGNPHVHVILRGGSGGPNYSQVLTECFSQILADKGLPSKIMVDCSHANSAKQYKKQLVVCADMAGQLARGVDHVFGLMIESNLVEGHQDLKPGEKLNYGQSITDACVGWSDTVLMLEQLDMAVKKRRSGRARVQ